MGGIIAAPWTCYRNVREQDFLRFRLEHYQDNEVLVVVWKFGSGQQGRPIKRFKALLDPRCLVKSSWIAMCSSGAGRGPGLRVFIILNKIMDCDVLSGCC